MCHVLIIEDEALIALDLEMLLERHGATSFAFATAQAEAIAVARQRRPDIITSDVGLLEGTGPKAVEIIRIKHGPVPVIFITATPHLCTPGAQLTRIFPKPLDRLSVGAAFRALAFV